jgi:hypothetical protein
MKLIYTILSLTMSFVCWAQSGNVSNKLEKLSKEFSTVEKTDDGNIIHSVFITIKNDTLFIIDSKGLSNAQNYTNEINIIPLKEVAGIEYVEATSKINRHCDLKIKSKNDNPILLQVTELSTTPITQFVADEFYIYDAHFKRKFSLPAIDNTSHYKELESILKSLIE